ncbi:DUF397 domain-containing protein [Streptomyces alkaliterrae]|uniref:DUF397 domain-containing protein n=1 Tax=Streptomyces alkaliterrae TaxID=2213162 RepID=A0A5P0YT30_9ACTN|nr:DUF397 domain-containing protein [Streptomyces alkaliterrae]MBB1261385.1 DUF397 domain-containing protein [Streptomyces alkaliterrae]MQS03438.1 DUF397 domain-containing protein [Streptomyces alkaliterrae]
MTTHTRTSKATELAGAHWRKSSYSGGTGNNCVEVADLTDTAYRAVGIRDSKIPNGPALLVTHQQFAAFLAQVRPGA